MVELSALIFTIILGLLALFQVALILGSPLGHFAWGGKHRVIPKRLRVGSAISILLYALFVGIVLEAAGVIGFLTDNELPAFAIWAVVVYSFLGIGVNAISRSRPEKLVMTPLVTVLFLCALTVALS